jgi:thioredoxin reductase (NADPH)
VIEAPSPDVLVIGAGAAGVSVALWAQSLDLSVRVLEGAPVAGGQLHHVHFAPLDLAAGVPGAGAAIAARLTEQLEAGAIAVDYDVVAVALEPGPENQALIRTASGARVAASAVVVATGARRRHLDVPGEREFEGRGVSYSATRDRDKFAGRHVVVAGGGDGGFENALLLTEVGCTVTLVVRRAPRARAEFRDRVASDPRIEVIEGARITAVLGDDRLRAVRLESTTGSWERPAEGLVIKAGAIPNTEWCADALALDADGFVLVDDQLRASQPNVWAVGDVTHPVRPSLALAIGQGAQVMATIRDQLRPAGN